MFKITETGIGKIAVDLGNIAGRSVNLRPALVKGRAIMLSSIQQNITRSGRPVQWASLRASTLREKRRLGYSSAPLVRTGQLQRSISGSVLGNKLRIGTAVQYAHFLQFGTRKMKSRPFLLFQREDIDQINKLVMKHLLKGGV